MNLYKTNFLLMQEHNYSLTELENMIPWEREVYVSMLVQHLKKKQEQIERALKPIIEQLLRGKHGEKELYY